MGHPVACVVIHHSGYPFHATTSSAFHMIPEFLQQGRRSAEHRHSFGQRGLPAERVLGLHRHHPSALDTQNRRLVYRLVASTLLTSTDAEEHAADQESRPVRVGTRVALRE